MSESVTETIRIEIPIETIDETSDGIQSATNNMKKLEKAAGNVEKAYNKASEHVSKFDKSQEKTQRNLAQWAKEKYEVLLEAKDKISPIISKVGSGIKNFTGKAWNVTMKAVDLVTSPVKGIINLLKNPIFQAGAILGVSIGFKDTIDTYKNFEAAMSQVQAISGATSSELVKLTDKAKEMGSTTKFTAEESAEAFNYMAMAGWKTEEMLNGIEGILSLAAASGEDLATTSDIVTDALTAFNMKAADAGRFSDVLAAAASNANTTVSGMGETFKYAGAMAGSLRYSIEDVALMTGLMANTGIKGTMAGTALNSIFTRLSTNTNGAADAMAGLGIKFYTSEGSARDLSDVMEDLRKATSDMTAEQKSHIANTIAGTEAQKGLLAILNASEADYRKLSDAINSADGSAARMSETMLDNLEGSITLLQSAMDGVKISFGGRLAPYVRSIADWLTEQMPQVEKALDEMMDWIDVKVKQIKGKIGEMTASEDWQNADFFGKVKIAWDELIAEPFNEWWNSTGKAMIAEKAGDLGMAIGSGISTSLLMLLGIDVSDSINEGASIGKSFAKGFAEGFDFSEISSKLWEGFKNMLSNAGKLLPGGKEADLSSVISAAVLAKIASPLISGGSSMFKMGKSLLGSSSGGGLTSLMGNFSVAGELAGTGTAGGSGLLGLLGNAGIALGSGATSSAGMVLAGGGAVAGGLAAGATLISGGLDIYKAIKSESKDESNAYAESGAWKVGGVAAGAAAGAAIGSVVPVLGTAVGALVGAGVGGIAGWIKGNKVKEEYENNLAEAQEIAERAQKVFEATGFSINDVTFETDALNAAIYDTEVSAEQLGAMFQEAVSDKLRSKFGNVHLSLKEIQDIASKITFGDQTESINRFTEAARTSSNSFETFQNSLSKLDKMNWKASLGFEMNEDEINEYKNSVDNMLSSAASYLENKHYEATMAVDLLLDSPVAKNLVMPSLDETYQNLNMQIKNISKVLSNSVEIALEDGVITLNEQAEIDRLENQIADITEKISNAQAEAKFEALKIKYVGSGIDADSFALLQSEIKSNAESMTTTYDEALEVAITNLKLELSEGAIDQKQYDIELQALTTGYNAKIDELQVRVESFQLETIAEVFQTELDGILPEIEGTTSEKLKAAMDRALVVEPDPATWTVTDISGWFGLDSLSAETQMAVAELLQQTAESIPQKATEAVSEADYSAITDGSVAALTDAISSADYGPLGLAMGEAISSALSAANDAQQFDLTSIQTGITTELESTLTEGDYTTSAIAVTTGVSNALNTADMSNIYSSIDLLYANTGNQINSVYSSPFKTSADVDVTLNWNLKNPTADISLSGGSASSVTASISGHAAGGYVSGGPQLSWLNEEGYGEFVIPTNPSRRDRALDLYLQAGRMLGVGEHANGGFVGGSFDSNLSNPIPGIINTINEPENAPIAYNGKSNDNYESAPVAATVNNELPDVNVSINVNPSININQSQGQDSDSIADAIMKNLDELVDKIGEDMAVKLRAIFSNMTMEA